MPRKDTKKVRGLWERERGSDIWWIRYRADGVLKREKVGSKGNAIKLLNKRKNELMAGIKLPENMRQPSLRFKSLCDDIIVFSKKHHRDFRTVEIRVKRIVADFGETLADRIKPADIDAWLLPFSFTSLVEQSLPGDYSGAREGEAIVRRPWLV